MGPRRQRTWGSWSTRRPQCARVTVCIEAALACAMGRQSSIELSASAPTAARTEAREVRPPLVPRPWPLRRSSARGLLFTVSPLRRCFRSGLSLRSDRSSDIWRSTETRLRSCAHDARARRLRTLVPGVAPIAQDWLSPRGQRSCGNFPSARRFGASPFDALG